MNYDITTQRYHKSSHLAAVFGDVATDIQSIVSFSSISLVIPNSTNQGDLFFVVSLDGKLQKTVISHQLLGRVLGKVQAKQMIVRGTSHNKQKVAAVPIGENRVLAAIVLTNDEKQFSFDQLFQVASLARKLKEPVENMVLYENMAKNESVNRVLVELVAQANKEINTGSLSEEALLEVICRGIGNQFELDMVECIDITSRGGASEKCLFQAANIGENGTYYWNITDIECECPLCQKVVKSNFRSLLFSAPMVRNGLAYVLVCGNSTKSRFNKGSVERANLINTTIGLVIDNLRRAKETKRLVQKQREQNKSLRLSYRATLESLLTALDSKDHETHGHSHRVVGYTLAMAEMLRITGDELRDLRWGAMLHDIGKIGVKDEILLKPGRLSPEEWAAIKQHPETGYRMLNGVSFLNDVPEMVLHHHERFDGRGYPYGLKGDQIPFGARVFAVADAFDAMTSPRPYRPVVSIEQGIKEIAEHLGSQFCPVAARAFLRIPVDRLYQIRNENRVTLLSAESS